MRRLSNKKYFCVFPPTADSEDSTVSIQIKLENEGSDEDIETDVLYSPQMALKLALTEWLQEFGVPHQYSSEWAAVGGCCWGEARVMVCFMFYFRFSIHTCAYTFVCM